MVGTWFGPMAVIPAKLPDEMAAGSRICSCWLLKYEAVTLRLQASLSLPVRLPIRFTFCDDGWTWPQLLLYTHWFAFLKAKLQFEFRKSKVEAAEPGAPGFCRYGALRMTGLGMEPLAAPGLRFCPPQGVKSVVFHGWLDR